eukprot:CAMPEP_0175478868 /NCGR_PEP_ID=MMETSP0095-20121207/77152_1 /TAXON_ID=311494 /ORGANISM="Alexandrium monilatum, Strain CCMP3105" /LENGTH=123 /DNA_ID=CAMNT_0016780475 /DNA_START=190 /DNA_END=558 /DNA_ORIENTATION=-
MTSFPAAVRGAEAFQLHHQEWRRSPDSLHLLMQILGVVPVSPLGALAAAGWDVLGLDRGAETLLQLHRRFAFLSQQVNQEAGGGAMEGLEKRHRDQGETLDEQPDGQAEPQHPKAVSAVEALE